MHSLCDPELKWTSLHTQLTFSWPDHASITVLPRCPYILQPFPFKPSLASWTLRLSSSELRLHAWQMTTGFRKNILVHILTVRPPGPSKMTISWNSTIVSLQDGASLKLSDGNRWQDDPETLVMECVTRQPGCDVLRGDWRTSRQVGLRTPLAKEGGDEGKAREQRHWWGWPCVWLCVSV